MKFSKMKIVMILLVIDTIAFSGCSDSTPSEPSAAIPQITVPVKPLPSNAATTAQQPGSTIEVKATGNRVVVFNGDYHWAPIPE